MDQADILPSSPDQGKKSGQESKSTDEPSEKPNDECSMVTSSTITRASDIDPFDYVKRGFTSEIYKIEITSLPRIVSVKQIRKRLESMNLKPCKIKSEFKQTYAFITFRSEEDRDEALKVIPGHLWKGSTLGAKKANPTADPYLKKRKLESEASDDTTEKKTKISPESCPTRINDAVTPLWRMPYEEQLEKKTKEMLGFVTRMTREIQQNNSKMVTVISERKKKHNGLICEFLDIIPSPCQVGYRNKCEFTVGTDSQGKEKTVGFRLGLYREGTCVVQDPKECINVSDTMKKLVHHFQQHLSESPLSGFDPITHEGHWRQLTVRETCLGEVLLMPEICFKNACSEEEMLSVENSLLAYFTGDSRRCTDCNITTIVLDVKCGTESKKKCIYGESYITEEMLDMKFRISPEAFFQVNTKAAELLYKTVGDWCDPGPMKTILDVCCGTGTIGLSLAKKVEKVVGVEMVPEAIEDAKVNAQINGIQNAEFVCGKAEDVLRKEIERIRWSEIVAVVDPPRSGLNNQVVRAIRSCQHIKRLVYVSCNPKAAMVNLIDLCKDATKRMKGHPFIPVKVVPVDLFPHTDHCELLLLLERFAPPPESNDTS